MEPSSCQALQAIRIEIQGETISLAGELAASDATLLEAWFHHLDLQQPLSCLELGELDISDGVAATHMINIVRLLLSRADRITLSGAPQLLAHNLYRAGMLYDGCAITLDGMREDEPYG